MELHRRGLAHSVETWVDGRLAGGLYGVALGRMFYGESMFSRVPEASKIALAVLVHVMRKERVPVIDCQQNTRHLASLGAREISRGRVCRSLERIGASRADKLDGVREAITECTTGWTSEATLKATSISTN